MTRNTIPVDAAELEEAVEFFSSARFSEVEAHIRLADGRLFVLCDDLDEDDLPEPLSADLGDPDTYLEVPTWRDLDAGRRLVDAFVREHLPQEAGRVSGFFRSVGAYGRFKDLLDDHALLQTWYDYEAVHQRAALAEWTSDNGLELVARPTGPG